MSGESCVFCEIAVGRAPVFRVAEDALSVAILDINPLAEGHTLVISKRHVPLWDELTEAETASLFGLARVVAQRLRRVYEPDLVTMYARGRRIPHTHVFLVPTFSGDPLDRFFNALEGFQEAPVRLAGLADRGALEGVAARLRDV